MLKKSDAVKMFGKGKHLAAALGKTPGAIGHWDEDLTEDQINMVVGAAYRRHIPIPESVFKFRR